MDDAASSRVKRRPLRLLSVHEQAKIIHACTKDFARQQDVAAQYRVSPALVGRLVRQQRKDPFILSKKLGRQHRQQILVEAVELVVAEMMRTREAIENAETVRARVRTSHGLDVSVALARDVMKRQLRMSYRMAKKVPRQGNTERCLVLRQQYALTILPLLEQRRRVINVDETWLNDTTFYRRLWYPKHEACTMPMRAVSPRISVIAAIDTDGHVWFALTQANTDSNVLLAFMRALILRLDRELPGWEQDSLILLDGAKYHTSPEMRQHFEALDLPVMYTAPYSYSSSPIERLFAALKLGELNRQMVPTGKR